MRQFKQTWLAVADVSRWMFGFCVNARCLRNALRRQRFARRNASSYIFTA
jgi:hypothetical protein